MKTGKLQSSGLHSTAISRLQGYELLVPFITMSTVFPLCRRAVENVLGFGGLDPWGRGLTRVEARGVFARDFDKLQQSAFPALNRSGTVNKMAEDVSKASSSLYSTGGDFLSIFHLKEGSF